MGFFRTKTSTPSGFRRASLGSMLTLGGVVASVFVGLPRLHRAMSVAQPPAEMTCLELLQSGIPEQSSLVVLSDAVVHPPGDIALPNQAEQSNPALARVQTLLASPRAKSVVDQLVRGNVLPRGVPNRGGHQPLKLSLGREAAKTAQEEIDESGSLTVQVTADPTARLVCQAASWFKVELPESLVAQKDLPSYTLYPAAKIGATRDALIWVVAGGLAITIGMVSCGSARFGWWFVLSPFGFILGLPGIPLRNGRGNRVVRFVSFMLGVLGLAVAYQLMVVMGGLGQPQGQWWLQATGLLSAALGLAALLGTYLSSRTGPMSELSVDPLAGSPSSKSKSSKGKASSVEREANLQLQIAAEPDKLSSMKAAGAYTRRYMDPRLSVSMETQTTGELGEHNQKLEKLHFDSPLIIETCVGDQRREATVQVGCRNLVLATISLVDDEIQTRMTSVLADGHVVMSSNGSDERIMANLDGDFVCLRSFDGTMVTKLVTKHLEVAAMFAEQRGSQLIALDSNEWRDLIHFTERCLADALHHAKIEKWDVSSAHYGRFSFPPSNIGSPALAGSV